MKDLLFLVHRIPYPPNKGDKIRSYNFLKDLALHFNVHLGTFIDDENDWQYMPLVDQICTETFYQGLHPLKSKIKSVQGLLTGDPLTIPYYKNQAMQAWVDKTLATKQIKKVLIFSSAMAQFIQPRHNVEMIIDFVDVDSDKWRQYAEKKSGIMRWVYQREAKYLLKYEKEIAQLASMSCFVSEQEAALFKSLASECKHKITHVNNGVDTDMFSPEQTFESPFAAKETALVFTGAMDYWANVDAVVWFAENVLPRINQLHPDVKFYIVGSKPTKDVDALAENKNVIVTGAVKDVRPYVAHAKLSVAPLRIARGIQNKVLEAMALGKHIVATSAAMEGIPYTEDLSVSVSDDPEVVAQQVSSLLEMTASLDDQKNREFVQSHFGWHQSLSSLIDLLQ